jgi:hypothetical protein
MAAITTGGFVMAPFRVLHGSSATSPPTLENIKGLPQRSFRIAVSLFPPRRIGSKNQLGRFCRGPPFAKTGPSKFTTTSPADNSEQFEKSEIVNASAKQG